MDDDPRLDHRPQRLEPTERWPLASDFHPFALRPDIDSGVMHFRGLDHPGLGWGRWQPDIEDAFDITLKSAVASEPEPEPIVVTGARLSGGGLSWTQTGASGGPADDPMGDTIAPPPLDEGGAAAPDEREITITVQINRTLTPSEEQALQKLQETITAIDAAIRALASNAILVLPNGKTVTGADLKAIWAKIDFVINENEPYGNLSYRGEANVFGQDTQNVSANDYQISFNIHNQALDGYDHREGGMNYLVAHELGHLTQWWTPNFNNEQMANDIGRAILASAGLDYLGEPEGGGYSTQAPMQFTT